MPKTTIPSPGVVLDIPEATALLHLAVQEGMLDDSPMIAGGYDDLLLNPPGLHIAERALEQLVVGGKVLIPFRIPKEWRGELLELGVVAAVPKYPIADQLLESVDGNVICEMLSSRDWSLSLQGYHAYIESLLALATRWETATDEPFKSFQLRRYSDISDAPGELIGLADEIADAILEAWPILDCISVFTRVIGAAFELGALSSLPLRPAEGRLCPVLEPPKNIEERLIIANVVCRELRTIPRATTLRGTIRLARSDECKALRDRLAEWSDCLRCGDNRIEIVRDEVAYAQRQIASARSFAGAGALCTAVAIPLSSFEVVNPTISAALNWTVNISGVIALTAANAIYRQNRWAMIGSVPLVE